MQFNNLFLKTIMLFKNNSLNVILHAAKTEIDTMLLRLSNLICGYLCFV